MSKIVKTLTLADAKAMTQAAEEHALLTGMQFAVAILDQGGHLLQLIRGDGVSFGCIDLAINKAYTAMAYGRATHDLTSLAQPGQELYGIQHSLNGRAVIFGGGIPIFSAGRVIGAVGASAGTVDQDIAVARAAVSAWTEDSATTNENRIAEISKELAG